MTGQTLWTLGEIFDMFDIERGGKRDTPVDFISQYAGMCGPRSIFLPRDASVDTVAAARYAIRKGAEAAFITAEYSGKRPIYQISDFKKALKTLMMASRARLGGPLITVTGSVGKTSTTHMLSTVLAAYGQTYGTVKNANTRRQSYRHIASIPPATKFAVIECAAGEYGLSRRSLAMEPDVAIVTNVGVSHMEMHGTQEKLLEKKLSLLDGLKSSGIAIVGAEVIDLDAETINALKEKNYGKLVSVGPGGDVEVKSLSIAPASITADISVHGTQHTVTLPHPVEYLASTASFVLAAVDALGLPLDPAINALRSYNQPGRRIERHRLSGDGVTGEIIDDAYNSAPESVRALMKVISRRSPRRKILVLGDMLELGPDEEQAHIDLVDAVQEADVDILVTVGRLTRQIADRIGGAAVISYPHVDEAIEPVTRMLRNGDLLVLKGSNGMELDKLLKHLASLADLSPAGDWYIDA